MTNFLLVYDRSRGALLREAEFSDTREAMRARSRDDLLRTHGRYFLTTGEPVERFSSSVRAAAV